MKNLGFLFSKRWLGYFALLIVFNLVCVFLGFWQLDRRTQILEQNAVIENNYSAPAQDITTVVPDPEDFDRTREWTPVTLKGEYLVEKQLLARARPYRAQPGFAVLVPFKTENGQILIIDRGWVPTGHVQDLPDWLPEAPAGQTTVTARLRVSEPLLTNRSAPEGQVASINVQSILEKLAQPGYEQWYGALVSEQTGKETGELFPRPELTEGPHLSYSLQWFVFAIMAILAFIALAMKEYREQNPQSDFAKNWQKRSAEQAKRKAKSDDEIEDEIIDSF